MFCRADKDNFVRVEYIIRNKFSYPGGTYGSYGGYDIVLLKLAEPVSKLGPEVASVHLPLDESFPDIGQGPILQNSVSAEKCFQF
jgi:hypothetical protein